eukprot:gb/GFBE01001452.1/.p1 GENE.gb/GFBE01001452.1/~~gb/GFBE01001452.1/.p1  ORF type:complete len:252 (+),score=34.92 gb/GFBE01001452.1/:1-756(+)
MSGAMSRPQTSAFSASSRDRSWLRVDRGVETYALQGPDSPRLPHQISEINYRAENAPHLLRRVPSEPLKPVQRWWLREVTHDKSMGKGVYEVTTGMVSLYPAPDSRSPCLGAIRAGTRFMGRPRVVNGAVWIKIQTKGVSPPMFSHRSEILTASCDMAQPVHRLFADSGLPPLSAGEDLDLSEDIWVEHNIQYIIRVRDMSSEKGKAFYHLTANPVKTAGFQKRRQIRSGPIPPLESMESTLPPDAPAESQ